MTDACALQTDVLVVGAGPAGLAAAVELDTAGLRVIVVDENPGTGGQIWRRPFAEVTMAGSQPHSAARVSLPANVRFLGSTVCVGFDGSGDSVLDADGKLIPVRAGAVILATGAYERVVPMPGWTVPGVMTAGAAQTLLKGSGLFPYRQVVVAGTGPLLLAVASQLLGAGVTVAAVVEAARPRFGDLRKVGALLSGGHLVIDGAGYLLRLLGARVPLLTGRGLVEITGGAGVENVLIRRLQPDWSLSDSRSTREIACDAVLLSYGFSSSVDLAAQAGVRLEWDAIRQSWRPWRTDTFETSRPRTFAVGDCAGVGGAQVATLEGSLAGLAVARLLVGGGADAGRIRRLRRKLSRLERFRRAMDELSSVQDGAASWVRPETVLCRCQGTTAGELGLALASGVSTPHGLKLWSRAGMGRCQGRICAPIIRDLLRNAAGSRVEPIAPSVRFPIRPVTAGSIAEWSAQVADARLDDSA